MPSEPRSDRFRIAQKLAAAKNSIALSVSDQFFVNHPDWLVRYGEQGRQFCTNDVRFHLDFLVGAIEASSPDSFADYALWTTRMLEARNITSHSLQETFSGIASQLASALSSEEYTEVSSFMERAKYACVNTVNFPETYGRETGLSLTRDVFLAAILNGQRQAALNIIKEALRAGHSHIDIYVDVFADALHRVGKLWELNQITVAQEHMATAVTQYAVASIYPMLIPDGPTRGQMIVTGVSGEMHQIGANLVADAMESKGWSVRFLGSNTPHAAILQAIDESSADVLCISTTLVANLPSTAQLVRSVRNEAKARDLKIILGGAAYRYSAQLPAEIGAQGGAMDLRAALDLLCQ